MKRGLLHAFGWTLSGRFTTLLTGLVASALTSRQLGPSGRGVLAEMQTWVALFACIFGLSLDTATYHIANKARYALGDGSRLMLVSIATLVVAALGSCSLVLFGYAFPGQISEQARKLLPLMVGSLVGTLLLTNLSTFAQALGRVALAAAAAVIQGTLSLGTIVIAYSFHRIDVPFVMGLAVLLQFVAATFCAFYFVRAERPSMGGLSGTTVRSFLGAGLKQHVATIATFLYTRVNQLIVFRYCGERQTGLFAVAFSLAFALFAGFAALQIALYPRVLHHSDDFGITVRSIRLAFYAGLALSIPLVVFAPHLLHLYGGGQFEAASPMFRVLVPAAWILSLSALVAPYYIKAGAFGLASATAVVVGVASVLANVVLVRTFQGVGAALATLVTAVLGFGLVLWLFRFISGRSPLRALLPDFRDEVATVKQWLGARPATG